MEVTVGYRGALKRTDVAAGPTPARSTGGGGTVGAAEAREAAAATAFAPALVTAAAGTRGGRGWGRGFAQWGGASTAPAGRWGTELHRPACRTRDMGVIPNDPPNDHPSDPQSPSQ